MRIQDLHELPKLRDGLSYLYLEHGRIDRRARAVEFINQEGRVLIPVASLAVLMLGPGTSITHEAIKTLADNGCLVNWCGEEGVRFYAQGVGETRKGYRLIRQAELVSDPARRLEVVRRMYQFRFEEELDPALTLQQIRGMEGARVRRAYAEASRRYGVFWMGRAYDRGRWYAADPINRALSAANACLNGLCHAAIVSAGYSPGLGFIHTGKMLSFVYDVADLYKTRLTVPLAFRLTAESPMQVETRVRHACRDLFHRERLLGRILDDIDQLLNLTRPMTRGQADLTGDVDADPALPGELWAPEEEDDDTVAGGVNYGGDDS
ncbi:MAG: CRISPR-associated endonuclease Cas1 2 [Litorilinea sp.]|nr:MAG: CRISPR-associated endonuclease Cas1 2 [Litorilinea sp.]